MTKMKKPMRIAIYSGDIPSTTFIERLIDGLSREGHTVYLFGAKKAKVSYGPMVKDFSFRQNRLMKLLFLVRYSLLLYVFKNKSKQQLDTILRTQSKNLMYAKVKSYPVLWHQPDIFHVQWAKALDEWMWVQEFGMKLVLSLRGAHINYSPIADKRLADRYRVNFPKVDGFHAVSKAMADEAQRYGAIGQKVKVVYSGLNLEYFKQVPKKQNQSFHIISVGRPHWVKGYSYALDACHMLNEQGFDFNYVIVGADSDVELLYQVNDLQLQQKVHLLGTLPFNSVLQLIQSSDLLLLPSLKEGVPNVVLEAMACGTMVLSAICGGVEEVISHGENGFLVPIRNSKAISEMIGHIIGLSESEKQKIVEQANATIKIQHTHELMIGGMQSIYRQAMTHKIDLDCL